MAVLYNPWPEVILQLRTKYELTQEDAAERADVSANTWHRWERPDFLPNAKQLEKILSGLGCTPDELGAAFALAMAKKYLELVDGGGEPGVPGAGEDLVELFMDEAPADQFSALLESVALGPEPEDLETLIRNTLGKSISTIAAVIAILNELIICWPRFRAEASDQDQQHVMLVRTHLHQLLDVCLTVSEELHQIALSRRTAS